MNKKKALRIIKEKYGNTSYNEWVYALYDSCPYPLISKWRTYWDKINNSNGAFISTEVKKEKGYLDPDYNTLVALTRLVMLHYFIEDTYK